MPTCRRKIGAYSDSYRPAEDERALTGEGVHCYIVDSGLELGHDEFEEQRRWSAQTPRAPFSELELGRPAV